MDIKQTLLERFPDYSDISRYRLHKGVSIVSGPIRHESYPKIEDLVKSFNLELFNQNRTDSLEANETAFACSINGCFVGYGCLMDNRARSGRAYLQQFYFKRGARGMRLSDHLMFAIIRDAQNRNKKKLVVNVSTNDKPVKSNKLQKFFERNEFFPGIVHSETGYQEYVLLLDELKNRPRDIFLDRETISGLLE